MEHMMLSGVGAFIAYFVGGLVSLLVFIALYVRLTPYREFDLIRQGNRTAALSLSGNVLGFAIVLYTAISHSVSGVDVLLWSVIGFLAQYASYHIIRQFFLRHWLLYIEEDNVAAGILAGALSIAVGLLNAASMSY